MTNTSSKRYISQTRVAEIGEKGQEVLARSSVLIIGCGALGSPLAMYLAGTGIGTLILADFDTVDLSNLHRQVFYSESDLGKLKTDVLENRIRGLNHEVNIIKYSTLITERELGKMELKIDMIADCADNPATTYMLDEFCFRNGLPLSTAGVSGWKAQIFTYVPGNARFSDFFPKPDDSSEVLPCSLTGILGPTAAFGASVQSAEIIKTLLGLETSESTFVSADLLNLDFNKFAL